MTYARTSFLTAAILAGLACTTPAEDTNSVPYRLKNDPFAIPIYSGKILPFPREAVYQTNVYALSNACILTGKGLNRDDARLRLLADRIVQYGGTCRIVDSMQEDCGTIFAVGATGPAEALDVPDHPQGYAIRCFREGGRNIVVLKGADHLGLLWAINSLIQMITWRDSAAVLHAVDVRDYPFMLRRTTTGPGVSDYVAASRIYPLMTKLDEIHFTKSLLVPRRSAPREWIDWRPPRPKELTDKVAAIGKNFKGLGITWEVGIMPFAIGTTINEQVQVDSKGDEHFDIVWKLCEPILEAGGGINYTPDDYRYPLSPADEKNFGTAREADIYFINRLYDRMRKSYPRATMSFVQPFYHGPRTKNPWAEESPIEYLKAMGERIPKDIAMAWTGPSVKTRGFTREDTAAFANLIQRKPFFWQNASDTRHTAYITYPSDVLKWWLGEGRDKAVYLDFAGAGLNSPGLYPDMLWSAMLWNPDGYDAEQAAYHATCQLVGPENYDTIRRIVEAFSWFDQFDLSPTPAAARKIAEIESKIAEIQRLSEALANNAHHPAAAQQWASFAGRLKSMETFRDAIKKNKDLARFAAQTGDVEAAARKETPAFNPEADRIFTASGFSGGYKPRTIFGRHATWIYGAKSRAPEMTLKFEIEPYPPETGYALLICGRDGGAGTNCAIEIKLNGKSLFKGPNPFSREQWSAQSFKVPLPALQRSNVLAISNLEESAKSGVPYFALNYLVVRKVADGGK
ncbi:MAG: beta-N-acetylglucosaminidase domain-containing protein [Kiritimatiellae bacterium]|nr:beta-N-acetylglucosaminidase domain-containing protein [Kiritimatiellia bacterium]